MDSLNFKGERTEKSFEEDKMKGKYPWFFSFEASKPAKKIHQGVKTEKN
ncbi:MAG: hypothetical protein K2I16_09645 [Muribaculaceae bacterium]|nr:hypothetical protein [Muribaculaceae bacterium]